MIIHFDKNEERRMITLGLVIESGKNDLQWSSHSNDTTQSKHRTIDQILSQIIINYVFFLFCFSFDVKHQSPCNALSCTFTY